MAGHAGNILYTVFFQCSRYNFSASQLHEALPAVVVRALDKYLIRVPGIAYMLSIRRLQHNFAWVKNMTQSDAMGCGTSEAMMTETAENSPRQAAFSANLRRLCDQQGSITQVCRKMRINRQQFNKYLAGRHMPSTANIKAIADHFGVSPDVLFAPEEEFRILIDGDFFDTFNRLRGLREVINFLTTAMSMPESTQDSLLGVYDRYHFSSIYPRRILRASLCIYPGPDLLHHVYLERFPNPDDRTKTAYKFKYHGFVLPIEGRVFTVDFESSQCNELTFGIYSPVQRNAKSLLLGITSGIAATMYRQPFSTRIALHYRRPGLLTRADIARATALDFNDASIPSEVREYLGNEPDMIKPT